MGFEMAERNQYIKNPIAWGFSYQKKPTAMGFHSGKPHDMGFTVLTVNNLSKIRFGIEGGEGWKLPKNSKIFLVKLVYGV